jgi:hypothetical protein
MATYVSCSSPNNETTIDQASNSPNETLPDGEEETTEAVISDELPEKNYNGQKFTILIRTGFEEEFISESETGELVNDAIYARNRAVEERFNVDLETTAMAAAWANPAFNNAVINTVMAGDDSYQIIAGYAAMIMAAIQPNLFYDWLSMPYVNLEKPWWSEQIADSFTINGKLYAMTGDIALTLWQQFITIFYNKQIALDNNITDLYSLVKSGDWTFDKLTEYSKNITRDLDGNGTYDFNDMFGYGTDYATAVDAYQIAFDLPILKKTSDGSLECVLGSEKTIGAMQILNQYISDSGDVFMTPDADVTTMFKENRTLFFPSQLNNATKLRDMETDFGVLPYPKLDSTQSQYYTTSVDGFSLFLIPATSADKEFVGIITEALSAENNRSVIPVYYNIVLKDKLSRDLETSEMIDIIRDNLKFDLGYMNSYYFNGLGHIFVNLIRKNSSDIASEFAKVEPAVNAKIATMMEAYQ